MADGGREPARKGADRKPAPATPSDGVAAAPAAVNPAWQALALRVPPRTAGGAADDPLEREADRVAETLVPHIFPAPTPTSGAGGAPLDPALRRGLEPRLGVDLASVRLHTDTAAADAAAARDARAFTAGDHVAFGRGQLDPGSASGRRLLGHELAHVAQQRQGAARPGEVQRQRTGARSRRPFERVLELHRQRTETLDRLVQALEALPNPTPPLTERLDALRAERDRARTQETGAGQVVDAYLAGEEYDRPEFPVDALNYVFEDRPNTRSLERLERTMRNQVALADLVRPRVAALAGYADALGADAPAFLREAFHRVAGFYLEAVQYPDDPRAFEKLAFLDAFYQDPALIQAYALWGHVRSQIPDLYASLRQASQGDGPTFPESIRDARTTGQEQISAARRQGLRGRRMAALMRAGNRLLELQAAVDAVGELPRSLDQVTLMPAPADNAALVRLLLDTQIKIAVLTLWQPIRPLQDLIYSHQAIGTTLDPRVAGAGQDRSRWLNDLTALETELSAEFDRDTHPDIGTRVQGWEDRLNRMLREIPPEARRRHITAAIVEQIPFMFVAGATVARVGLWVRGATSSRWLVALAEGATMTAFTALGTAPGSPGRPTTALGWAGHAAMNVLWARLGRALFDVAGDAATRIGAGRLVLVNLGTRVVAPGVALATLQTAAQTLEARVTGQGGDTTFTELLTINLILHGMGLAIGIATAPPTPAAGAGGSTALARPGAAPPTAAELARLFGVSEDVARQMLEVAARTEEFMGRVRALNDRARSGRLSTAEFEQLRREGLELADFLEGRLTAIARGGGMGDTTPEQVQAGIAAMRARIQGMVYNPRQPVTALLPQNVEGLVQTGEGPTWTYDQSRPPARLPQLRASYQGRGYTVRALPSGGWEAEDAQGRLALQVLPLPAQAVQAVRRTLPQIARGRVTEAGLARVRAQTGVAANLLEAQLTEAAGAEGGESAVQRVLQHLGRFVEPTNQQAWRGLSNFLSRGGDVRLLARGLAYGQPVEFAAESRLLANRLLELMAGWGDSAVRGFGALYRLRPSLTAERLHNLVADFEPEQVRGILESLDQLEGRSRGLRDVIGPLTSGSTLSERGAMGALTSGVQLAERFPQATLVFEAPVQSPTGEIIRVIDISVREQQTTRIAGRTETREVEIGAFEVKEVSTSSLGRRATQELARDIARDSQLRGGRPVPTGAARPFFETFRWRIRGEELRQQAMRRVGTTDPTDPRVEPEMRRIVQSELAGVFSRPEFLALPPAEQSGYRGAFAGVPFVEFF